MTKFASNLYRTTSCCMQFTSAKNHRILPTHSNVITKIVAGFTLRGPPCIWPLTVVSIRKLGQWIKCWRQNLLRLHIV